MGYSSLGLFPKDGNKKTGGKAMTKKTKGPRGWLVIIRAEENTAAPKSPDWRLRED